MISYGTALLFIVHGPLMGPLLKDRPADWFDEEKFLCEICAFALLAATYMRYKYPIDYQATHSRKEMNQA